MESLREHTTTEALLQRIQERRSVAPRRLVQPGPSPSEIAGIVRAACAAPDHKRLRPFRFEVVDHVNRPALADVFEAAAREMGISDLTRERERASYAPVLLALIVAPVEQEIPLIEQYASAGAALGYTLLAAECLGYGAMAVSGDKLRSTALRTAFALTDPESLLCFIALGTPEKAQVRRREERPLPLRWWTPPLT